MIRDDELARLLTRAVETVEPSDELWDRTRRRARRAVRRRATSQMAAALVLVLLAVAVPRVLPLAPGGIAFLEPAQPAGPPDQGEGAGPTSPAPGFTDDVWTPLPGAPIAGRVGHTATWAGDRMVVWGGAPVARSTRDGVVVYGDGAQYLPAERRWEPLPPAPLAARRSHTAVWSGRELLVWGGTEATSSLGDGAAFDPATQQWRALSPAPLTGRGGHTAVWTGREMIVWGGGPRGAGDGAAYDPETDRWRALPAAPLAGRLGHAAVWTGEEMLVVGGLTGTVAEGGRRHAVDAAAYDPAEGTWRTLADAPRGLVDAVVQWAGDRLLVWGGVGPDGVPPAYGDGAAYDAVKDAWSPLPPSPLSPRSGAASVWTGDQLLVWSGSSADGLPVDGAAYEPARDVWVEMGQAAPAPLQGRDGATAVWTGEQALVWGGGDPSGREPVPAGGAYVPWEEGAGKVAAVDPRPVDGPQAGGQWTTQVSEGRAQIVTPDAVVEVYADAARPALALAVRPGSTADRLDAVVLVRHETGFRFIRLRGSLDDPDAVTLPADVLGPGDLAAPPLPVFSADGEELAYLRLEPEGGVAVRLLAWQDNPYPGAGLDLEWDRPATLEPDEVALAIQHWRVEDLDADGVQELSFHLVDGLDLETGTYRDAYLVEAERGQDGMLTTRTPTLEAAPG